MYKSHHNKDRVRPASPKTTDKARVTGKSNKANNVFADSKGDVHRKTDKGWEKKTQDGWKPEFSGNKPSQKPAQKPAQLPAQKPAQKPTQKPAQKPSQINPGSGGSSQQLNKSYNARQRGSKQTQNYNRTRTSGRSGGGGGKRR